MLSWLKYFSPSLMVKSEGRPMPLTNSEFLSKVKNARSMKEANRCICSLLRGQRRRLHYQQHMKKMVRVYLRVNKCSQVLYHYRPFKLFLRHQHYLDCLINKAELNGEVTRIVCKNHQLKTQTNPKVLLSYSVD